MRKVGLSRQKFGWASCSSQDLGPKQTVLSGIVYFFKLIEKIKLTMCNASFFRVLNFPATVSLVELLTSFILTPVLGKSPRLTDSGTWFWSGSSVGKTSEGIPGGQFGKQKSYITLIHVTYEKKKISR